MNNTKIKIAITGAAGNLGGLLANRLLDEDVTLNLLYHNKEVNKQLKENSKVTTYKVDLARKETLEAALTDVDVIIHFAGVLFKANPEKFLPETNTVYFKNLLGVWKEPTWIHLISKSDFVDD